MHAEKKNSRENYVESHQRPGNKPQNTDTALSTLGGEESCWLSMADFCGSCKEGNWEVGEKGLCFPTSLWYMHQSKDQWKGPVLEH